MPILTSKNNKISKSFYEHHEKVEECFKTLIKFVEKLLCEDPDPHQLESLNTAIDSCESAADRTLRQTVDLVHEVFLPVTRANLISIAQSTDEVANLCQDVARQVVTENIRVPKELHHDIDEILLITEGQLALLYASIDKLLNDFNALNKNRKILDDIRAEESRVDDIEDMLHKRIFRLDLPLYEKVYYRDLILSICDISDTIEDVADQIQVMLVQREA